MPQLTSTKEPLMSIPLPSRLTDPVKHELRAEQQYHARLLKEQLVKFEEVSGETVNRFFDHLPTVTDVESLPPLALLVLKQNNSAYPWAIHGRGLWTSPLTTRLPRALPEGQYKLLSINVPRLTSFSFLSNVRGVLMDAKGWVFDLDKIKVSDESGHAVIQFHPDQVLLQLH